MSSRADNVLVNIDAVTPIAEPAGYSIMATVDGVMREFSLTETSAGSFLAESTPDANVPRLGRVGRTCVLEAIESELLRELPRAVPKAVLHVARALAYEFQAKRDTAERAALVREILTGGVDAFRQKYGLVSPR